MPFWTVQLSVAVALTLLLTAGFFGLDYRSLALDRSGVRMWSPSLRFEDRIPFRPGWIWVYIAYYPICFTPLLLREVRHEPSVFWRTVAAYLLQFGLCFLAFWLWPSKMLRPELAGEGLTRLAVETVFRLDPGYNIFPSLHVSLLVFTALLLRKFRGGLWQTALWAAAGLIAGAALGSGTCAACFQSLSGIYNKGQAPSPTRA